MYNLIKKYKSQIIVGVVTSLIATLIIQAGKMFMSAAPKVSSSIIGTVVNCFYSFTATRTTTTIICLIGTFLIGILAFISFVLYLGEKITAHNDIISRIYVPISEALIIGCILAFILFLFASTSLYETFEDDIIIISPYVEEKEILRLKSDWKLMRSKDDYIAIQKYIQDVKEEHSLIR